MMKTILINLKIELLIVILFYTLNINAQNDEEIKLNKNSTIGKIKLPSGDLYEGEYTYKRKGLLYKLDSSSIRRNGAGITYYKNTNKIHLVGNYINDTISGEGTLFDTSGSREIKGNFQNGFFKEKVREYSNKKLLYEGLINDSLKWHGTGICYDSTGKILYTGEFKNGKRWGQGTFYNDDKIWYKGNWNMDKPNGKGIQSYLIKNIQVLAEGYFEDGVKNGNFIIYQKESKDTLFIVNFKNGKMNGYGKQFADRNKLYYEGNFSDNEFEGNGIIYDNDGNKYFQGIFHKGRKNGPFTEFYPNGKKAMECTYINDTIKGNVLIYYHSNGKLKWAGNYENNLANGFGISYALGFIEDITKLGFRLPMERTDTMQGRKTFEGEYKNGNPNGQGTSYYENGAIKYFGSWINGSADGKGITYRDDGSKLHEGEYKNGKVNGLGTSYNQNSKKIFEGYYIDGAANGYGTSYDENGKILKQGNWINGQYQEENKITSDNKEFTRASGGITKENLKTNNNSKNKLSNGSKLVRCSYCGNSFKAKHGFVFNIEMTINHCVSYNFYEFKLELSESIGLSRKYLELFTEYYCSSRCCNIKGYTVEDF